MAIYFFKELAIFFRPECTSQSIDGKRLKPSKTHKIDDKRIDTLWACSHSLLCRWCKYGLKQ